MDLVVGWHREVGASCVSQSQVQVSEDRHATMNVPLGFCVERPRKHLRRSASLIHNRIGSARFEVTKTSFANKVCDTYRDVTVAKKAEVTSGAVDVQRSMGARLLLRQ